MLAVANLLDITSLYGNSGSMFQLLFPLGFEMNVSFSNPFTMISFMLLAAGLFIGHQTQMSDELILIQRLLSFLFTDKTILFKKPDK